MPDKIAVIHNKNKQLTSLEECCSIGFYQATVAGWQPAGEIYWQIGDLSSMTHVRNSIRILIEHLDDCRIILGRKISGLPYHVFDKMGFHIFESECQESPALFQDILCEISDVQKECAKDLDREQISKSPVSPNSDGNYSLNLIDLQKAFPEISSKKALQQFIEDDDYLGLELICSHIPPWMELSIARKNVNLQVESLQDGNCLVILTR
ncbi:Fe-only nitrogenase accessory AnfO family protein [Sinanaerobacter chloroacetimidivorans]|jgi:Fe-only nitrogenase accessory protein AnfO|uniref:Fe-only nitrogenase accessory protein AnfO n=1 Tax=Sinanaerobacter chloroacetimidivorans TaxID=2818044 RepID=A0A8J7W262_9FIRM|nr:Fe-only nitrogenase accessory AnfO family protein [Sinanaerobacter chloroacetimidivorans]MBR0597736.1 hypothetical protein [Sinanaerobacter chloroacetimidivorans]